MTQAFNHYFTNIAAKVDEEICGTRKSPLDYLGKIQNLSLFLSPADQVSGVGSISELEKGKSVGPYSISCNFLKMLNPFISPPLGTLINESFSTGVFPDKLKMAEVMALHKKGATNSLSNYRPISRLSAFSKIFEKFMHKRQYSFLEVNEILYPLQFGF